MKKAIAVLCLGSSLLPALAQADDVDRITDKLLKEAPLQCLDEALVISNNHLRRVLPDLVLDRTREFEKLGQAWGPGNENYRQARDMLEMAFQDDELSNGPLIEAGLHPLLRTMVAGWTPAQRVEFQAFLTQKGGRLYWDTMMDGAMCEAMIALSAQPPHPLPPGADKYRLEALATGIGLRKMTMELEFNLLPKDQAAKAEKLGAELGKSVRQAFGTVSQAYAPRAHQVFEAVAPDLKKIVAAYKP
ncbi:hypothetical protein SAMN05518865_107275 [Duganella sp. CF458]|uniref:hypothetical protein n=1 Tax=Duganella sp. CF458 TaxID=1884368 RepID=UPI0008EC10FE|nr:hypothetical protein [Duganella sp. CF458]SFG04431.1 hypothetical protein SAMN05518865_107275 [Duganella sp. CF458]